jgi:hypothetical protein
MNYTTQTVDALALLDEATTGMAGSGVAQPAGREADYNQCCTAEFANIAQLADGIGFGVNCGALCTMSSTNTVLTNGQDFAATEENGNMGIINTGLLGIAALLCEDMSVKGAGYPRGQRRRRVSRRVGSHPVEGTG